MLIGVCWLLCGVYHRLLLVGCCLMCCERCVLSVVGRSLCVVRCVLLVVCRSLLADGCLLLVALVVVCCLF